MTHIETAARSDTGLLRDHNEDSTLCTRLDDTGDRWLLAVADGVGGVDGGEVASTAVVSELAASVRHLLAEGEHDAETLLREGYAAARREFVTYATDAGYDGAGTTLVASVVDAASPPARATVLNVGDSRAYRYSSDRLRQVTTDHTVGRELGTAESVGQYGHVLSRWVGVESDAEPDVFTEPFDGTLLLCSDGLTNELTDEEIRAALAAGTSADATSATLVELALARGGRDNVSVVLASVRE